MRVYLIILCCFCLGCRQEPNKSQLKADDNITVKNTKTVISEPLNDKQKVVEENGIFLGKVNGKIIKYNYSYIEFSSGHRIMGSVSIYTKDRNKKIVLLDYNFDGYDFGSVKLVTLLNHPFIYISQLARHGQDGMLYSLDLKNGITNPVNYNELTFVDVEISPYKEKKLEIRASNGLSIDNNNITSEDYYRSGSDTTFTYKCKFKLVKIKHNTYTLKLTKATMTQDN